MRKLLLSGRCWKAELLKKRLLNISAAKDRRSQKLTLEKIGGEKGEAGMGKRAEARAAGAIKYRTGKKCKWGHASERLVSNEQCCDCERIKRKLYQKKCQKEINAYNREYYRGWRARRKAALNGSRNPERCRGRSSLIEGPPAPRRSSVRRGGPTGSAPPSGRDGRSCGLLASQDRDPGRWSDVHGLRSIRSR